MKLSVSEKIRLILSRKGMTVGALAEATGQTRQNLSNKLSRSNFTEKDIEEIAEALGWDAEITFTFPDGTVI